MFRRILLPVDGSRSSTSVVPYAAELAQSLDCQVDLLLVEPKRGIRLPHPEHHHAKQAGNGEAGTLRVGSNTSEDVGTANERFLARHIEEFDAHGVAAKGHVYHGEPVEEILRAALDLRCDMIAMATRHRGRFARSKRGSVADEVLWRSRLPVLLVADG